MSWCNIATWLFARKCVFCLSAWGTLFFNETNKRERPSSFIQATSRLAKVLLCLVVWFHQTWSVCVSVVWFSNTLLHDLPQVRVLHGGRHALLIVDLFVNWERTTQENQLRDSATLTLLSSHTDLISRWTTAARFQQIETNKQTISEIIIEGQWSNTAAQ